MLIFMEYFFYLPFLAAFFSLVMMIIALNRYMKQKGAGRVLNVVVLTLSSLLAAATALFLLLAWWLFSSEGFFGQPVFIKQYDYPDKGVTFYLYDNSFLDPVCSIRTNTGWMPVTEYLTNTNYYPEDVTIVRKGDTVSISTPNDTEFYDLNSRTLITVDKTAPSRAD